MMKRIHLSNTKKLFDFPDHFTYGKNVLPIQKKLVRKSGPLRWAETKNPG